MIQYSPGKEVAVIAGVNGEEFGVKEDDSKKRGPLPLYSLFYESCRPFLQ